MSRLSKLVLLALSTILTLSAAVPRLSTVEPPTLSPGVVAFATGVNLEKGTVAKLYLTAGGSDIELEITEQTADKITFKVPAETEHKRYRMMFLTTGEGAAYMEQPVSVEVMDEAAAKAKNDEESAELEIVDTPATPSP
jgi:hypothetical protein